MEKGKPIPVILKKRIEDSGPLEINIQEKRIDRRVFHQEQVSLDKIVKDSASEFYITGKSTKIALLNFLHLIKKHDLSEVDMEGEDIVLSSDLITKIATANVIDDDEESLKYIDASAIGIFIASFFLSIFVLLTKTQEDIKTFAWILLLLAGIFLANYLYRGYKSKELKRLFRLCIKSLSKK